MNLFKSRKFRQGSVASVITILVLVLIVVINMVAGALSDRFSMSLDLTQDNLFTLSQESVDFLKTVEKPVVIYVLNDEDYFAQRGSYYQQAGEVIRRYAQQCPAITVKYVDIVKDPSFAAGYPDLTLNTGNILVTCEDKSVVLTAYDLFNTQVDYTTYRETITSSKAEQSLSSAILNVTSDKTILVSVLEGHNEANIASFTSLLQMNNFDVITQNLMTEDINPEATVAIMSAPSRDITEAESKKLDAWLSNGERMGKTFLYMAAADQQADAFPVLDAFLADWGIGVSPGVVFELTAGNLFQMNYFATLTEYMEDDFSKSLRAKNLPFAMAEARPLEFLYEAKNATTTVGLLEFSETAGVSPETISEDWAPAKEGSSGPILALGMGQRTKYDQLTPLTSSVVVSGSNTIVSESLLSSRSLGNSEYMLNLLNVLAGRDETISIQNKTISSTQLGIQTAGQVYGISIALTIVLPLAVLIFGIVIWARRRHR